MPSDRLLRLSEEVSRIANNLAQLSVGASSPSPDKANEVGDLPDICVEQIDTLIRGRRERNRYFPQELLADPMWDMMLDLLRAEVMQHRISVSSACLAAGVPATTALRWLKVMEREKFIVRERDPFDGRRVFVALTAHASCALRKWFADNYCQAIPSAA